MIPQNVAPILVMNTNTRREHGRKAQRANIAAAKVNIFKKGNRRYRDHHSRSSIDVEDAIGPNGRNRDD